MLEAQKTHKTDGKPDFAKMMAEGGGLSGFTWPENCGNFDMRIAQDGTWFYRGSPIGRLALVKLFATVLQRDEEGNFWLVTPVERGLVTVDDAPFVIVEIQQQENDGQGEIQMRTNLGHWVRLDDEHQLEMRHDPKTDEDRPYIHVRDGLDALINRATYYHLIEMAEWQQNQLLIRSAGQDFIIGELAQEDND